MNIFVFTIVRLIFNLLASSKLISFLLIWLNFVIAGTGSSWFVLGVRGSETSWHHCDHDFTRLTHCEVVIWNLCSWKEVQTRTCSMSSEGREDLSLIAFKLKGMRVETRCGHVKSQGTHICLLLQAKPSLVTQPIWCCRHRGDPAALRFVLHWGWAELTWDTGDSPVTVMLCWA